MSLKDVFKPRWKHSDPAVRASAVKKITEQKLLATIAGNDWSEYVRIAAVERIDDQNLLSDITKSDSYDSVRKVAIERLDAHIWQDLLDEIASNDEIVYILRKTAADKLGQDKYQDYFKNLYYIFEPLCLECDSCLGQIDYSSDAVNLGLVGGKILCPECGETHHYELSDESLTISRFSHSTGDIRPKERIFSPLFCQREPGERTSISQIVTEGFKLVESQRYAYFAKLKNTIAEFNVNPSHKMQRILEIAEGLSDPERHTLLSGVLSGFTSEFDWLSNYQKYYTLFLIALSLKNMERTEEAKIYTIRTLRIDPDPKGLAWTWIYEWFPEHNWSNLTVEEKQQQLDENLKKLTSSHS